LRKIIITTIAIIDAMPTSSQNDKSMRLRIAPVAIPSVNSFKYFIVILVKLNY